MLTPEVRAELQAMRDRLDQLLGMPEPANQPAPPIQDERVRMPVCDFARARGYHPDTITKWANLGMPHVGQGKARRILVREADAWIASGGPQNAAKKSGQRAAQS
jgi:hypothetical protein